MKKPLLYVISFIGMQMNGSEESSAYRQATPRTVACLEVAKKKTFNHYVKTTLSDRELRMYEQFYADRDNIVLEEGCFFEVPKMRAEVATLQTVYAIENELVEIPYNILEEAFKDHHPLQEKALFNFRAWIETNLFNRGSSEDYKKETE